jgi:S1-C subfamily serine protease
MIHMRICILSLLIVLAGCAAQMPAPAYSERFAELYEHLGMELQLLEETRMRTVKLKLSRGSGSGVIFTHRGAVYVLTATHVLTSYRYDAVKYALAQMEEEYISVEFFDGTQLLANKYLVIGGRDIAIIGPIRVPAPILTVKFLDISAMSDVRPGMPLLIWGSPYGYGPSPLLGTLAYRVLHTHDGYRDLGKGKSWLVPNETSMEEALAFARKQNLVLGFQSSSHSWPGVSGGPVFDEEGRLFGIVSQGYIPDIDPTVIRTQGLVGRGVLSEIVSGIGILSR